MIVYGIVQVQASQSVWTYLGDGSYTLYLTHTFAISPLMTLWLIVPAPSWLVIAVGVTASVVFAWRFYELVEKPIMARIPRVLRPTAA
jgi:exopolysaccharide production protein ExoZ